MTSPQMNWDDLRIFLELGRTGLLARAAGHLHMDQTTVSRRLQRLEHDLGITLFERTRRGHHLTPSGHDLMRYAEDIESAMLSAQGDLADADQHLSGTVRVNVAEGFGAHFIAPRLGPFTQTHPAIEVELVASANFLSVSQRETDIAVHLARPTAGRLIVRKLTDYRLQLYASTSYLETHSPIETIADLNHHTLVGYIDDLLYAPELRYLEDVTKVKTARLRSSSIIAQFNMVKGGFGAGILHCFMAKDHADLVPLLPEDTSLLRTFWLIYPEELKNVARIRAFTNYLVAMTEAEQDLLLGR